jgi:uncharacterized protein
MVKQLRDAVSADEKRTFVTDFTITNVEARDDSNEMIVEGYAAVFDTPSKPIWGMFVEEIKRGAFRKCLQRNDYDTVLNVNHEGLPLARLSNNSLTLSEDSKGLKIRGVLIPTTLNKDIHLMVQERLLAKMSFAFTVQECTWNYTDDDELDQRYITEIKTLYDVSIVTDPAYDEAEVDAVGVVTESDDDETSDRSHGVQTDDGGLGQQTSDSGTPTISPLRDDNANPVRGLYIQSLTRRTKNESCTKRSTRC